MFRLITAVSIIALTTACGSGTQPFNFNATDANDTSGTDTTGTDTTGTTGDEGSGATNGLNAGTSLPPGTDDVSVTADITRFEARNGNGGGLVNEVTYNASNDTFNVDGLGFDGANVYSRDSQVGTLNGYAVFESDIETPDSLTGTSIDQITPHRALFGASKNNEDGTPRTSFAIVRTGGYVGYGFGGFIYERNGGVTLPTEGPTAGQARFAGDYAGIRVFAADGGIEYTRGDMTVDIDFRDFNANDAVKGTISNRAAFEADGALINDSLALPDLKIIIQEGAPSLTENGEISGNISSFVRTETGALETYESGTYYGVIAGDATDANDGGELVGVIVVTSDDPRKDGVTAQETGGFILYR